MKASMIVLLFLVFIQAVTLPLLVFGLSFMKFNLSESMFYSLIFYAVVASIVAFMIAVNYHNSQPHYGALWILALLSPSIIYWSEILISGRVLNTDATINTLYWSLVIALALNILVLIKKYFKTRPMDAQTKQR